MLDTTSSEQVTANPKSCGVRACRGAITLITGCMFSGKTTELLRRVDEVASQCVMAFKHRIDNRYQRDAIVTHGGKAHPACVIENADELLAFADAHIAAGRDLDLIALDEAHFFESTIVSTAQAIRDRGIHLAMTALDRDSWGRSFPLIDQLADLADACLTKHATCARCGGVGERTQRLTPIVAAAGSHRPSMVGGAESYEPRCCACWFPPPEFAI